MARQGITLPRRGGAGVCLLLANAWVGFGWWLQFWGWN
jgi:hypothetical protein